MGIIFQVMLRAEISNNIIFYCKSIRIQDLIVGWLIAAIMLFLVFARKNKFHRTHSIIFIGSQLSVLCTEKWPLQIFRRNAVQSRSVRLPHLFHLHILTVFKQNPKRNENFSGIPQEILHSPNFHRSLVAKINYLVCDKSDAREFFSICISNGRLHT